MLLWTDDKEKALQKLYKKHKGTPLEHVVNRLSLSVRTLYVGKDEYQFFRVLKSDEIADTRQKQRRNRIRRYVRGMLDTFQRNTYLVTLTFSDESLALLSPKTRQRYVRDYLQSSCLDYMACIDFGKKTGREHYHALCAISPTSLQNVPNPKTGKTYLAIVPTWDHGYHSVKPLRMSHKDLVKSCAYAFKASNYAFKNASSEHRTFHARNVEHVRICRDDFEIDLLAKAIERLYERNNPPSFSCATSSGFEVSARAYETPYAWVSEAPLTETTPKKNARIDITTPTAITIPSR